MSLSTERRAIICTRGPLLRRFTRARHWLCAAAVAFGASRRPRPLRGPSSRARTAPRHSSLIADDLSPSLSVCCSPPSPRLALSLSVHAGASPPPPSASPRSLPRLFSSRVLAVSRPGWLPAARTRACSTAGATASTRAATASRRCARRAARCRCTTTRRRRRAPSAATARRASPACRACARPTTRASRRARAPSAAPTAARSAHNARAVSHEEAGGGRCGAGGAAAGAVGGAARGGCPVLSRGPHTTHLSFLSLPSSPSPPPLDRARDACVHRGGAQDHPLHHARGGRAQVVSGRCCCCACLA